MLLVTLIGYGAIGQALVVRLAGSSGNAAIRVTHVVVREGRVDATQAALDVAANNAIRATTQVPPEASLVLECAGHGALVDHVIPALARGVPCAVLSVGALAEPGLPEQLEAAARQGRTQVHLLSGAIGAIDALAAARLGGLTEVTYTGRKPPSAWAPSKDQKFKPESQISHVKYELLAIKIEAPVAMAEVIILESSAREAARLYPKNANVAATVALAGLGLDATRVRLIADRAVSENVHEIHAKGAFGEFTMQMRGKPLPDNPKTSALTVLSALRFLNNRAAALTL
jgi:aspartate dehydrogenase